MNPNTRRFCVCVFSGLRSIDGSYLFLFYNLIHFENIYSHSDKIFGGTRQMSLYLADKTTKQLSDIYLYLSSFFFFFWQNLIASFAML